jgi:hypothetical protein
MQAHDGELGTVDDAYEVLLCNGYRKSIPYFEEKNNPFLAYIGSESIFWQGNRQGVEQIRH